MNGKTMATVLITGLLAVASLAEDKPRKLWQNAMTSLSLFPLGSKSLPPLPPPMGRPVRLFFKICSSPKNLRMDRFTLG